MRESYLVMTLSSLPPLDQTTIGTARRVYKEKVKAKKKLDMTLICETRLVESPADTLVGLCTIVSTSIPILC